MAVSTSGRVTATGIAKDTIVGNCKAVCTIYWKVISYDYAGNRVKIAVTISSSLDKWYSSLDPMIYTGEVERNGEVQEFTDGYGYVAAERNKAGSGTGETKQMYLPSGATFLIRALLTNDFLNENGYVESTASFTLPTVDRRSYVSVSSPQVIGNAFVITTNRKVGSYTHTIALSVGGQVFATYTNQGATCNATIPVSAAAKLPSSTSGTCRITTTTFSGSTNLGSTTSDITVHVPTNLVPSIGAISLSDQNGFFERFGYFLGGKSRIKASFSESTSYGAAIKTRQLTVGSMQASSSTAGEIISGLAQTTGLPFSGDAVVQLVDARGRSCSGSARAVIKEYQQPTLNSPEIYRSNSDGTKNQDGTCISVKAPYSKSALENASGGAQNFVKREVKIYKMGGELLNTYSDGNTTDTDAGQSTVTYSGYSASSTYQVYVTLTDSVGSITTYSEVVSTAIRPFSVKSDGQGVAFGKVCEEDGFEVAYEDARFNGVVHCHKELYADSIHPSKIGGLLDLIYPVGSVYISAVSTSPATLFGGSWEQLKDRFLIGAGNSYNGGAMGGETSHTLTIDEMPSHNHTGTTASSGNHKHDINIASNETGGSLNGGYAKYSNSGRKEPEYGTRGSVGAHTHSFTTSSVGSGHAHNNMPPYLAVYMWKRTE